MAPRLSGQTSIFGGVSFVSKSLLGIVRQKKLKIFTISTRKPRSHVRILIYRMWPIRKRIIENAPAMLCPLFRSWPGSKLVPRVQDRFGQWSGLGQNRGVIPQ